MSGSSPSLDPEDRQALEDAAKLLENPGFAIQATNLLGKPLEYGVQSLPETISRRINDVTRAALQSSLRVAVSTLKDRNRLRPANSTHKVLSGLSGAVGGAFGLSALAVELPVSTLIMLRSIADIARVEGEDLSEAETQLACLEVFALGGNGPSDDSSETAYYATRAALARVSSEAAKFIAEKGLIEEGAPVMVRLISHVAKRFSIPVSQKFAAQSVPAIGAAGGAAINLVFINHFQDMARGHFTIRRLERKYGAERVRAVYEQLAPPRLE